jgi:hypothetical protein
MIPLGDIEGLGTASVSRHRKTLTTKASFFSLGKIRGRTFICVVDSGCLSSTLTLFEPSESTVSIYREFLVPSPVISVHFLFNCMCLGAANTFEVVNIESLETQKLINPNDKATISMLLAEPATPIAMFCIDPGNDILLCYSGEMRFLIVYVDRLRPTTNRVCDLYRQTGVPNPTRAFHSMARTSHSFWHVLSHHHRTFIY